MNTLAKAPAPTTTTLTSGYIAFLKNKYLALTTERGVAPVELSPGCWLVPASGQPHYKEQNNQKLLKIVEKALDV